LRQSNNREKKIRRDEAQNQQSQAIRAAKKRKRGRNKGGGVNCWQHERTQGEKTMTKGPGAIGSFKKKKIGGKKKLGKAIFHKRKQ